MFYKILFSTWFNLILFLLQVATVSVFSYFFFSLFGAQFLVPQEGTTDFKTFPNITTDETGFFSNSEPMSNHTPYLYFPFFTVLEFVSYMGWIKVAETLLNPFGDDDEVRVICNA